jgi:5-formaminoimidazole-4-carboxamide-1-(beta)-D-ribofuranosyl 5'-monophosphate synthetase
MIQNEEIAGIVEEYDRLKLRIGMTASHSALDICDGAIEEGFPTVAYCKEGRHKTYANYFKTHRSSSGRVVRGMVDKAIVLEDFNDVMMPEMQAEMRKRNVIYIPNRSFTSYSKISDIEEDFKVPMFGSRNMLRMDSVQKSRIIIGFWKKLDSLILKPSHHPKK